jgi:hypothetical protein
MQAKLKLMHAIHNKYAPSSFNNIWITNQECNPGNNLNLRNDSLYAVPHPPIELLKNHLLIPYLRLGMNQVQMLEVNITKPPFLLLVRNT